jgi:hypothetical protein
MKIIYNKTFEEAVEKQKAEPIQDNIDSPDANLNESELKLEKEMEESRGTDGGK